MEEFKRITSIIMTHGIDRDTAECIAQDILLDEQYEETRYVVTYNDEEENYFDTYHEAKEYYKELKNKMQSGDELSLEQVTGNDVLDYSIVEYYKHP